MDLRHGLAIGKLLLVSCGQVASVISAYLDPSSQRDVLRHNEVCCTECSEEMYLQCGTLICFTERC